MARRTCFEGAGVFRNIADLEGPNLARGRPDTQPADNDLASCSVTHPGQGCISNRRLDQV